MAQIHPLYLRSKTQVSEKSKGVTLSALCKVLNFPRWVYFSTGRAGFRSRRDVSGDRAANTAHTLKHTRICDVHPCTDSRNARAHTAKHNKHKQSVWPLLQGLTALCIGIQCHFPPISRLSQHTHSQHCPRGMTNYAHDKTRPEK